MPELRLRRRPGEIFQASTRPAAGLVEVHRLFRAVRQDFMVTADPQEYRGPRTAHRVQDRGISFYASPVAADCLSPIYQYPKDTRTREAASKADRDALVAERLGVTGDRVLRSGRGPDA